MIYSGKPKELGRFDLECLEMMFYQYLPIKLPLQTEPIVEERLRCFEPVIGAACCDFIADFGINRYVYSYVYLTAKRLFQSNDCTFNRKGYHSDGFLTEDINYVWSDGSPTVFNSGEFDLSLDDSLSMQEMEDQAKKEDEYTHPSNTLLRMDQFVIHKVSDNTQPGMRTFCKISFSKDRYDLKGNSKNYLLDYDWAMRERKSERNIPQKV